MPARIGGLPTQWLAVTNGRKVHVGPARMRLDRGSLLCRHVNPMNPDVPRDVCPDDAVGVVNAASQVARVRLTTWGGVSAPVSVTGAKSVAVHVTPTGSRADKRRGTELRVVVRLADGRRWVAYVPETHPALLDRASADSNGSYVVSTVRIALPAWVTRARLASVGLGGLHGGRVDVRGIDVLTGRR